jgi:hypothetical protein
LVSAPWPSARCISTLSSQRPNIADHAKTGGAMQRDRWRLRRIANHRDHLPETATRGFLDKIFQQCASDAAALRRRIDIDRILDAVTVGQAWAIGASVGVADDAARDLGDDIWIAAVQQAAVPPRHFGFIGRFQFERRGAVFHGVGIDAGDGGNIGRRGVANRSGCHRAISQEKGPGGSRGLNGS